MNGYFSDGTVTCYVKDMVNLVSKKPVKKEYVAGFQYLLMEQCWDEPYEGERVVVAPIAVLLRQKGDHWNRITRANLNYPIIVCDGFICDGMHRLCKAVLMNMQFINVVRVTYAELIAISRPS